jgi:uracil-DNA glycosylase
MFAFPGAPSNPLFETDFVPHMTLPGFFPGAGGFFHGYPTPRKQVLFFGTDFGPLDYQQALPNIGGEPATNSTIRNLRNIATEAHLSLDDCYLTNAVLCMRRGTSATEKFPIWQLFGDYVRACAAWHRSFIAEHEPRTVVLMGRPHLLHFGRLLYPELDNWWRGLTSLKDVYEAQRELFAPEIGPPILLMHHPSFWHAHPRRFKERALEHLASFA